MDMAAHLSASDTIETFARLPWHDSKLLGFATSYVNGSDDTVVTLDVDFRPGGSASGRTEVRFEQARGLFVDVDFVAKSICSDDIASATCEQADQSSEEFVRRLDERIGDIYPDETMEGVFLFYIDLIHPGGRVLVLARSFSVTPRP